MNARAFQLWMGRLGLLAALLLVAVPTAGRLVHAAGGAHALHAGAHGDHGAHGAHRIHRMEAGAAAERVAPARDSALRPAPGDVDCDYCPLLAALVPLQAVPFVLAALPPVHPAEALRPAPRLPWLHPNGLGSRGPPALG